MPKLKDYIEKLYYSISEVADIIEETQPTIRFWEDKFSVLKPKKNRKGNRMFVKADIETLKLIKYLLRDRGYTIKGANEKIKRERKKVVSEVEVVRKLKKLRGMLVEMRDGL